jgi:hypothetical protein
MTGPEWAPRSSGPAAQQGLALERVPADVLVLGQDPPQPFAPATASHSSSAASGGK